MISQRGSYIFFIANSLDYVMDLLVSRLPLRAAAAAAVEEVTNWIMNFSLSLTAPKSMNMKTGVLHYLYLPPHPQITQQILKSDVIFSSASILLANANAGSDDVLKRHQKCMGFWHPRATKQKKKMSGTLKILRCSKTTTAAPGRPLKWSFDD